MPETVTVDKPLTVKLLQAGEVRLSEQEWATLGLPEHSGEVKLRFGEDTIVAQWNARARVLHGEDLTEQLQDCGRDGWLLRLTRRGGQLEASIVELGRTALAPAEPAPPPAAPPEPAPSQPRHDPYAERRKRLRQERYRLTDSSEFHWTAGVGLHVPSLEALKRQLSEGSWSPYEVVKLLQEGEKLAATSDYGQLLAPDLARVDYLPHQDAAVRKVLTSMRGRAVLADEVGLGKTIEAGLIAKELILRGQARRVLVVAPAQLCAQWQSELLEKFDERFEVVTASGPQAFSGDRLIVSLQRLRRHPRLLDSRSFDLLIVDEAHRLAGPHARVTRQAIGPLAASTRYVLFLTATPVQNHLSELYRLVELLRPGTFSSQKEFERRFLDQGNPRRPIRTRELRQLISDAMVRTTRSQAGLDRVVRHAHDVPVQLSPAERELYHYCLHTLRGVMVHSGDGARRRKLAEYLTVSPEALSKTALRIAENHPIEQVQRALRELGHLAADLPPTNRERTAVAQVKQWVAEHGRVLLFTQHTEAIFRIVRCLEEGGLQAAVCHGRMSAGEKAKALEAFRSGQAQVLVSTDVSAEGQNLQFCNCVLNYDLPWNPMRIEQRIGRVHRLTQERDVHVANLYAAGTYDEHVYWLLREKLRMFELLFGQVTTVLGELGESQRPFDEQVLDAVLARDDQEMERKFLALGEQLERAYQNANSMIKADEQLSRWLAEPPGGPRQDARELMPEQRERSRQRQQEVEGFVRDFLSTFGAAVTYEAEGFLSARLPAELVPDLGREMLHLAFSPEALDQHPDAELCAVGSEVFDELLLALRLRGNLHGTVANPPEISAAPRIKHAPWIRLVSRTLRPPRSWQAAATWKATSDDGQEKVFTVYTGEARGRRFPRRPLAQGEPLPAGFGPPAQVLGQLAQEALQKLDKLRHEWRRERAQRVEAEEHRLRTYYERQIAEREARLADPYGPSDRQEGEVEEELRQLKEAWEAQQRALTQERDPEVRARPLTLTVKGGEDFEVVEVWEHESGQRQEVSYPLLPGDPPPTYQAGDGMEVRVLALCSSGHITDAGRCQRCASCGAHRCPACKETPVRPCPLCSGPACGACRAAGEGICRRCARPRRREDLDDAYRRAWEVGEGALLLVGERHAELRKGGAPRRCLVPDEDCADPGRRRARAAAARLGLPPDTGVRALGRASLPQPGPAVLWRAAQERGFWTGAAHGGSQLNEEAAAHLPDQPGIPVAAEGAVRAQQLLRRLRAAAPPPRAPQLCWAASLEEEAVAVTAGGLERARRRHWPDGTAEELLTERVAFTPGGRPGHPLGQPVGAAALAPVSAQLDRVHRGYLLTSLIGRERRQWWLPAEPGMAAPVELALARLARALELPPGAELGLAGAAFLTPDDFAHPSSARLAERSVRYRWQALEGRPWARPFAASDLEHLPGAPPGEPLEELPAPLATALVQVARRLEAGRSGRRYALTWEAEVSETWVGQGTAARRYRVAPGMRVWPRLDDTAKPAPDFEVDSLGHLHLPGAGWRCPACRRHRCRACGPAGAMGACQACGQPACGDCRGRAPVDVPAFTCERCGSRSCGHCGRALRPAGCGLCHRQVCDGCLDGQRCLTCGSLAAAGGQEVAALPPELAAAGLRVWLARDGDATVAVLAGRWRREVAVLRAGKVVRWLTAAAEPQELLRTRLAAASRLGEGDVEVRVGALRTPPPIKQPCLRLEPPAREVWHRWELRDRAGQRVVGSQRPPELLEGPPYLGQLARLAGALGKPGLPAPEPADPRTAAELLRFQVPPPAAPARACLLVDPLRSEETVWLDAEGLHRSRFDGVKASRQDGPWTAGIAPAWVARSWEVPREAVHTATLDGYEAAIVRIGNHVALGVRFGAEVHWGTLREHPADLAGHTLGLALGRGRWLLEVSALSDPSRLRGPSITGGRQLRRRAEPELVATSKPRHPNLEEAALRLFAPGRSPARPASGTLALSPELRTALLADADRWREGLPRYRVGIGLRVTEEWALAGRTVVVRYRVAPGEHTGVLQCEATGEPTPVVSPDRAGHLVKLHLRCGYCNEATCLKCNDRAEPCEVCELLACGRCAGSREPALCRACGTLRATGRLSRWRYRSLRSRGGRVLRGQDELHEVTLVESQDGWTLLVSFPGQRARTMVPIPAGTTRGRAAQQAAERAQRG